MWIDLKRQGFFSDWVAEATASGWQLRKHKIFYLRFMLPSVPKLWWSLQSHRVHGTHPVLT
jgi:hypothetical protein